MAKKVSKHMKSHLFLIGLNHATAPVDFREQLTLTGDGLRLALKAIHEQSLFDEAVILSTCNRYEIYQVAESDEARARSLCRLCSAFLRARTGFS